MTVRKVGEFIGIAIIIRIFSRQSALEEWLNFQLDKQGVEVKLNTKAARIMLQDDGFEEVIVAPGSYSIMSRSLPGIDEENVFLATYVYSREDKLAYGCDRRR